MINCLFLKNKRLFNILKYYISDIDHNFYFFVLEDLLNVGKRDLYPKQSHRRFSFDIRTQDVFTRSSAAKFLRQAYKISHE